MIDDGDDDEDEDEMTDDVNDDGHAGKEHHYDNAADGYASYRMIER